MAVCLAGCGGDPLVGTWRLDYLVLIPSASSQFSSFNGDFALKADHTATVEASAVRLSTSSTHPGCTETLSIQGLSWSAVTNAGVSTLTTGGSPTGTQSRSGCMNASDNLAAEPTTIQMGMFTFSGPYAFSNNNNTLSVTNNESSPSTTITLARRP